MSLCFAEPSTNYYRVSCAKRALCFYNLEKYTECLFDINLAKKTKCTKAQLKFLKKNIRIDCRKKIKKQIRMEPVEPTLSFEPHEKYPEMANALEFRLNKEFGRHLVATTEIDVGQVLFIEKTFASMTVEPHQRCNICLVKQTNLIPCKRCTTAMFCVKCKNNGIHAIECKLRIGIGNEYEEVALAVRFLITSIKLFSNAEEMMDFVGNVNNSDRERIPSSITDSKSKYRVFLQQINVLMSQELSYQQALIAFNTCQRIIENNIFADVFKTEKHKRFLMHLFFHHIFIVKRLKTRGNLSNMFTLYAYFNHSCLPNILLVQVNDSSIGIAIRPIRKDEQVFKCYFPYNGITSSYDNRQKYLNDNYDFQCKCEWCKVKDLPLLETRERAIEELRMDDDFKYLNEMQSDILKSDDQDKRKTLNDKIIGLLKKNPHILWTNELLTIEKLFLRLILRRFVSKLRY